MVHLLRRGHVAGAVLAVCTAMGACSASDAPAAATSARAADTMSTVAGPVTVAAPPSTTGPAPTDALPLVGSRWSTTRDVEPVLATFELQRIIGGTGLLVGVLGLDGQPLYCSPLDATVTLDGSNLSFTDVSTDPTCDGAGPGMPFDQLAAVATSLERVTSWRYGRHGDEVLFLDDDGATALRVRGCTTPHCRESELPIDDPTSTPVTDLTAVPWQLQFRDSGMIPVSDSRYDVSAVVGFRDGTVQLGIGVVGGCLGATAAFELDDHTIDIGTFDVEYDSCTPSVRRLPARLTGRHRYEFDGDTLVIGDLRFVPIRPTG